MKDAVCSSVELEGNTTLPPMPMMLSKHLASNEPTGSGTDESRQDNPNVTPVKLAGRNTRVISDGVFATLSSNKRSTLSKHACTHTTR